MNYLKSVIKTTCIALHLTNHAVLPPHVKRFRQPAVSSQSLTEAHPSRHLQLFLTILQSVRSFAIQVEKLSCLVSIESFKFLTPLKICFTYDGPYKLCKK
jgi:hypothetical protein